MRVGRWHFKPKPLITLIYIVVALSMLMLGRWQMQRAQEKITLAEESAKTLAGPALPIQALIPAIAVPEPQKNVESDHNALVSARLPANYTRVSVEGQPLFATQFLWDNRIYKGKAGFEVIVPVRLDDGRLVLVNRGWLVTGPSRAQMPDVALTLERVSLSGVLTYPSRGFAAGEALSQNPQLWPRLAQYIDYNALQQALQQPLIAGLVQGVSLQDDGDANPGTNARPFLLQDNWQAVANGPEKHYGYAAQWFAMFAALSVLYVWLNLARQPVTA